MGGTISNLSIRVPHRRTRGGHIRENQMLSFILDSLSCPVIFEAADNYGLSARGWNGEDLIEGNQLINNKDHNDLFKIEQVDEDEYIFRIQCLSAPGQLFIGAGESGMHNSVFKAVLVPASNPSCNLRIVPARNGSRRYISFESVEHPGHLLNHCDGRIWFFNRPANNEYFFSNDCSWSIRRLETIEDNQMMRFVLDSLSCPVIFEAANNYGLSARGWNGEDLIEGNQLINNKDHNDLFKIEQVDEDEYIFRIQCLSAPGLFIGVGERGTHDRHSNSGFKAVLVPASDSSCKLRIVPARNGSRRYISFESVEYPGHLLNHCEGWIWFFDRPANYEYLFSNDSSWSIERFETIQEKAMQLEAVVVVVESTDNDDGDAAAAECPVCMLPFGDEKIEVMTECGHSFCMHCVVSICNMRAPSTSGSCAICRQSINITDLKRVLRGI